MKKLIALTTCAVLLSSGLAMAAELASGGISNETATIYGGISAADSAGTSATLIGKLSKSVKLGVNYNDVGTAYALDTKHSSGNTQYGTAADATAIYKKEVGTAALTAPSTNTSGSFVDWTAM